MLPESLLESAYKSFSLSVLLWLLAKEPCGQAYWLLAFNYRRKYQRGHQTLTWGSSHSLPLPPSQLYVIMLYFHIASWSLEISECIDCRRWIIGGLCLHSFGEVVIYAWVKLFHGAAALGSPLLLQVMSPMLSTEHHKHTMVTGLIVAKVCLGFSMVLITSEKPFLISARWKS